VLFGRFLKTEYKWRLVDGLAEFLRFFGASGQIVGSFGEEDGLAWCELCGLVEACKNGTYLGTFGDSLVNYEATLLQVVFDRRRGADLTNSL